MSTRMCRFRPLIFCPRRSPKHRAKTPFLRPLRGLRVDDGCGRARLSALLLAHRDVQFVMNALQRAVPVPELEIVIHRALGRQVLGQGLPLATGPQDVENPVQHLAHIHRPSPPAMSRRRNHRLDNPPFGIGQITRITKAVAIRRTAVFRLPHRALPKESSAQ